MRARLPLGDDLRAALGSPSGERRLASSPRSRVWRIRLGGATAVVKQIVGGDDAAARFGREVEALRLAGRTDPPVVPRVLAVDEGALVMVLEHLAERRPGPDWTTPYAATLARLHATTGPDDAGALPAWQGPTPGDVDSFLALAHALHVRTDDAVGDELAGVLRRLDPTPHHALLHGDPCPGNDIHTDDGTRFIDFEQASLGNGLVELAYLHVGFPTCWCASALPVRRLADAERAYRSTWRDLTGGEASGNLADACLAWLVRGDSLVQKAHRGKADYLARVLVEDWKWGPNTARERLLYRLGVVSALAERHVELTATRALTLAMREGMRDRWPGLGSLPSARPDQSLLSGELDD